MKSRWILFWLIAFGIQTFQGGAEESRSEARDKARPSSSSAASTADDEEGLGMNIFGGKDLPQVLYIVPWKAPSMMDTEKPQSQFLQTVFAPIDPEVFERNILFREAIRKDGSSKKGGR